MDENKPRLKCYLSPINVWALSFGCAVGWGSFVMPGTLFLPAAGPLGTAIGITVGAIVMIFIAMNYHFMMNSFGGAGGTYTFTKKTFGYDHGYMSAWFVALAYIAVLWANATALVIIAHAIFGDLFRFGFHYVIAGYDIYLGEALLSIAVIVLCGLLVMYLKKPAAVLNTVLAIFMIVGVVIVFIIVFFLNPSEKTVNLEPAFSPGVDSFVSVFGIVALAPWAFVGFESVSHTTGEIMFKPKKMFAIMASAVITGAVSYILLTLIAASTQPEGYDGWYEYMSVRETLTGFEAIPTFFATHEALGKAGVAVIGILVCASIFTGIIGNYIALSRLLFSMADDGLLPKWFIKLDKNGTPGNAVLFCMLLSIFIPFLGRNAIGWIVDITTVSASIAYGYTSAAALKRAYEKGNRRIIVTGIIGLIMSVLFTVYLLVPNAWSVSGLETESYLILALWSIVGFVYFRYIFSKDKKRRLGKSIVVWIALLFMIFLTSLLWINQMTHESTGKVVNNIASYYTEELSEMGVVRDEVIAVESEEYLENQMDELSDSIMNNSYIQMAIIVFALAIMFSVYSIMSKREKEALREKYEAEESNKAKSIFLSNMSHDIRTPMNAIVGYTTLAKKENDIPPQIEEYLDKIETSSHHLLALINDVLEMSRIESGKMDLEPVRTDMVHTMGEVRDMFATQMTMKSITYMVASEDIKDPIVLCDKNRLNRVLLNLVSNAYKFTPEGGKITVLLRQTGRENEKALFELRVRDSGIGMSPEFAEKVFDAFEREKTSTVSGIQGTGLGMAITKSIVDLMGGTIEVHTKPGEGTEFELHLAMETLDEKTEYRSASGTETGTESANEIDFTGMRVLLAEDNPINQEIAKAILGEAGFVIDTADNGKLAVEALTAKEPGYYSLILMDVQMPVMGGYDATRAIRALENKEYASIPIIAMTANAFAEDVAAAKEAGMDDHVAKPIDIPKLMGTLKEVLGRQ